MWDSLIEYTILQKYAKEYLVDVVKVYYYISQALSQQTCIPKQLKYVPIPVPVQVNVPVSVPVPVQVIKKVPVEKKIVVNNCEQYKKIIDSINDKIKILNEIYELK